MKVLASPAFAMQPPTRNVSAATPARATATPPTPASSARSGLLLDNMLVVSNLRDFMVRVKQLGNSEYTSLINRIQRMATHLLDHETEDLNINGTTLEWILHARRPSPQVAVTETTLQEFFKD